MRILAVDDCLEWITTHSILATATFGEDTEVVAANSAFEAINIYSHEYEAHPFDLVITDLQMEKTYEPLYAGEWLIREIRNLNENQHILIVSSAYNIEHIANMNNTDYICKRNIVSDRECYISKLHNLYD